MYRQKVGTEATPPEGAGETAARPVTEFTYWTVVPATEKIGKHPSYPVGLAALGMVMPETTICAPAVAVIGALSVTVTRLPTSLMAEMLADCVAPTLGRVKVVGGPNPLALGLSTAGAN